MIDGIGIDIVDIGRFKGAVERWGARLTERIFTERELAYCHRKKRPEFHMAARFAAKEAFFKAADRAFGSAPRVFKDVEIVNQAGGRPEIRSDVLGPGRSAMLSISHDRGIAVAQVVVEIAS